ncbi:MAG: tetratricopeptide repeat protein [Actinobacteria bacterium]|nr:tetratricopeptide repeat protein [Actinomycetota bacterium]
MKKELCVICSDAIGRRVCKINNNALICPVCCAKARTVQCEGCIYYTQAKRYEKEKLSRQKLDEFMMKIDPEINAVVDKALAMAEKGNISDGEKIISALLKNHYHIDMVHYGMGVINLMKEHFDKAIPCFERAIKINPYFVEAWYNKASAHQKRLEMKQMIIAYRKVIEIGEPSEPFIKRAKKFIKKVEKDIQKNSGLGLDEYLESMTIFEKAFAAMERMDWETAMRGFNQVLSMDPRHVQSHGNLGICYGHLGEKQKALAALDRALEIDPNYEPAIINRKIISSLGEGEKLRLSKFASVDYYKDFATEKKSLLGKIFKR